MTASRPVMNQIIENVRWVLCDYPTNAFAQEAEMALDEYADFLFGATNIDWTAMEAELTRIKARLEAGSEIRIVAPETDLTLRVEGRIWEPAAGTHNMPDGEIFTAPIEDATEGHIRYEFPAIYQGREVQGIRPRIRRRENCDVHGGQGRGVSHGHSRHGPRRAPAGRNRHWHQFRHPAPHQEHPCSTRRWAARCTWPLAVRTSSRADAMESAVHWDNDQGLAAGRRTLSRWRTDPTGWPLLDLGPSRSHRDNVATRAKSARRPRQFSSQLCYH